MRELVGNVRTAIKNHDGYVYIPDLRAYMVIEIKTNKSSIESHTTCDNPEKIIHGDLLPEVIEIIL